MTVTRIFDILEKYQKNFIYDDALATKRKGKWDKFSTRDYIEKANNFSYGLLALGFKNGDKIATISNNRPEWNFVDMGMSQTGVVHVPIYPTLSEEEYFHILSHSDSKFLIVSDIALYDKLKLITNKIPTIKALYTFDEIKGALNWNEIIDLGKRNADKYKNELQKIKKEIKPSDLHSIIYTSGTTGLSKGVMLSHNNFISNILATKDLMPLVPKDIALSFLPLCHVFERMVNYTFQYMGIRIYYAENMGTIGANLKEIKANFFVAVPRILEGIYDKIISKGNDLSGIKKALFFWAVKLGLRYELDRKNGIWYEIKLKIARKLIFSKWMEALGGRIKFIISGGASLQPRLARIFCAAGIPVLEGYGLTETSPSISVNHFSSPGSAKFGTVGPVINNVEVKIAEDGEIYTKGPNLMLGYYKNPEYTNQVIDKDGWFHTGDVGTIEDNKFLKITDRKKEIFKTSSGKYVAPQVIENKLKESFFIEQIMVVGENEKFVSALISPSFDYLHNWCTENKIHFHNNEELIKIPEVVTHYQKEIIKYNETFSQTEHIKRFRLVHETWTSATGELSPTLKLKRSVIHDKYKNILEEIYGLSGLG